MSFRDLSIQRKITIVIMLTTVSALLFAGGALILYELQRTRDEIAAELHSMAAVVGMNSVAALEFGDKEAGAETIRAFSAQKRIIHAGLYDSTGTIFALYDSGSRDVPTLPMQLSMLDDDESHQRISVTEPVLLEGKGIGTVVVQASGGEVFTRLREYAKIVILVLLLSTAIVFFLSAQLRNMIAAPILQLTNTANEVALRNDYSLRATRSSRDEIGQLIDRFNAMLDVVQQRDDALQQSEDELRLITDSVPMLISYIDSAQRYQFTNAVYDEWFGRAGSEIRGQHIKDVLGYENYQRVESYINQALSGKTVKFETTFDLHRRKDVDVAIVYVPRFGEMSQVEGFFAVASDITDRKTAERALFESEERLRLALSAAQMGTWYYDLATKNLTWDANMARLLGLPENATQSLETFLETVHISDRDQLEGEIKHAIETSGAFKREYRIVRPSGEIRWVTDQGRVYANARGRRERLAGVTVDVTDLKRAQEDLKRLNQALEQRVIERTNALARSQELLRQSERLASIGTLAAGIAHEINNPVNAILLAAQYTIKYGQNLPDDALNSYLTTILEEARRCGKIVKSVLQFAKAEKTKKWPHEVNSVVQYAAELAKKYIRSPLLAIDLDLDDDLPQVSLNPTEFEQCLVNLIKNASEAAQGNVTIRLSTTAGDGQVIIKVQDNGPGIPDERLKHIFDPFFSTRRERGGTGLGLSITHGIVTDHGGTMSVESKEGIGTTFVIKLPALQEIADAQDISSGR